MKKTLIIIASLLAFAVVASAQPRAIGVRAGYGAELSYQHNLGSENFLEVDLGWSFSSAGYFNVAAAYDFSVAPVGPFNFYAGPAADLALYGTNTNNGSLGLGVGAQLGLEYIFSEIPFQISLDWRPWFNFVDGFHGYYTGAALGLRYAF